MKKCNACGRLIEEDALVVVCDDPSPRGICLPSGHYTYEYCPHCGDDDLEDSFSLVDALEIEEEDETTVSVSFEGRGFNLYLDEWGDLQIEGKESWNSPKSLAPYDDNAVLVRLKGGTVTTARYVCDESADHWYIADEALGFGEIPSDYVVAWKKREVA